MRILLATAVAIAPLLAASGASAEVVISTARTTPITTSNATGTAADNIRIATGGSIAVNTGAAATVNSNNTFDMDSGSSITMANTASGSTGLLINGGVTSTVTVGGTINLTDDITSETDTDADNDGDIDGEFANGTARYGIRLDGTSPFVGNIIVESTGAIGVDGNDSYGISLEAPLTGNFDMLGGVNVTGKNSYGVRTTGTISGDARLVGNITVRGPASTGASVEGDVAGALLVESTITVSGYRYPARPADRPEGYNETTDNDDDVLFVDELDADDLLAGGPALSIAANIAGGVLLDRPPAYANGGVEGDDDGDNIKNGDEDDDGDGTINRNDTDRDGDGLFDASEQQASITSLGTAPAVQIGSTTQSITLGAVGTGDEAFGFINRGSITAQGIYDGKAASAMVIGGNAGQTVDVAGGVRNEGTIAAIAFEADSTGLRFGQGATADQLINSGSITAGVNSETGGTATAIRIDAGANVSEIHNSSSIVAASAGGTASTYAIRDLEGSLSLVTNTRSIQATQGNDIEGDAYSPTATAIDVSVNTTGFTYIQSGIAGGVTTGNPDSDGDGVADSAEPNLVGEVRLGSGDDLIDIQNGLVIGDIAFGAGADRLSITGGGQVHGALSDTDGNLTIDVTKGTLDARQTTALNISELNVGGEGELIVTLDPTNNAVGGFNVAGTATLADGAGLGLRFDSLLVAPTQTTPAQRFTLIDAGTLNFGDIDLTSIEENSPYLYVVSADADVAAGQVFADVRRRTAAEAEMIPVEASMFDSFYGAIGSDNAEDIRNAFLGQTNRDDFMNLYEQLLPDHSGGPLISLASGVDAVTRALTGRNASASPGETSAWVQEISFYADKDKTDSYGFRSEGFGVAGGVERGTGLGAIGITAAFTSSDLEDPEAEAEEVLSASLFELGLYWRAQGQYWTTWARAAAGYGTFSSERRFVGEGLNLTNTSDWHGFSLAVAGGASYERNFGSFNVRPEIYAEYFSLSEDGHTETGGGDGFDLEIDDREGHLFSATAAINIGMSMGENNWLRPEMRVGWRQNISMDPGATTARFLSGGDEFTLSPAGIEGGGPILGFRLNVGNELGMLSVSADAEMIDDYIRYMLFLRASFRF
ncbi:autotransporter outer membrane beta-barrel domain-containing protein [Brevundimonas sp. Root1279]|uniref:autotransporter outer membrane beta-barrel domain-containing protein n=1 Tax=Brevundimonas sp. Root1279 TaxID=1736443 RepID=UPI0006FC766B|nr:autotransporter outer membrane beta-barrel domain-containing protein [Brevundimonas sp. Root1279]KQW79653.1 autotransporter subunit beta [Brevundimonas sp. Root1279]